MKWRRALLPASRDKISLTGASQNLVRPEFLRKSRRPRLPEGRDELVLTDGRRGANQILRRDKSARFTKDSPILPGWLAGPSELPMLATGMAVNLKTLDLPPLSEVLVDNGIVD